MRRVKSICLICNNKIKNESVIYISGATSEEKTAWDNDDEMLLEISFTGKRSPRGAIHRSCWEKFFIELEENKKIKPISLNHRIKSIE